MAGNSCHLITTTIAVIFAKGGQNKEHHRKMRGRIVPLTVDKEHDSEYESHDYKKTPKHKVTTNKFDSFTSFTVPNATCNKCGKDVFYYENSYGSRVLFDALAPLANSSVLSFRIGIEKKRNRQPAHPGQQSHCCSGRYNFRSAKCVARPPVIQGQSLNALGITFHFQSFQQSRQDRRVVIHDRVGNQPPALVTDVCFNVIFSG